MQNIRSHSFSKCDLALSRKVSPAAFILGDLTHIKVMISKKTYQNVAHFFTLKYLQLKLDWAKNTRKWTWQICNTSWREHEKISRDGIKRGFEGKENIEDTTAVKKMNWKRFFPLWKRLDLCWKTQKWKQRTFCFQVVSKALSLVLTAFRGKGFDKSHAQANEEVQEIKGEQRCWGLTKPLMGTTARNCRETTPGGVGTEVNNQCEPQHGFPKYLFS